MRGTALLLVVAFSFVATIFIIGGNQELENSTKRAIPNWVHVALEIEHICRSSVKIADDWEHAGYHFEVDPERIPGCRRAYVFYNCIDYELGWILPGPGILRLFDDMWFGYMVNFTNVVIAKKSYFLDHTPFQALLPFQDDLKSLTAEFLKLEKILTLNGILNLASGNTDSVALDDQMARFVEQYSLVAAKIRVPKLMNLQLPQSVFQALENALKGNCQLARVINKSRLHSQVLGNRLRWVFGGTFGLHTHPSASEILEYWKMYKRKNTQKWFPEKTWQQSEIQVPEKFMRIAEALSEILPESPEVHAKVDEQSILAALEIQPLNISGLIKRINPHSVEELSHIHSLLISLEVKGKIIKDGRQWKKV